MDLNCVLFDIIIIITIFIIILCLHCVVIQRVRYTGRIKRERRNTQLRLRILQ